MSKQLKFSFANSSKFKHFSAILSKKEKFFLYLAFIVLVVSMVAWTINYYIASTEKKPAIGGEYTEGMVGQPVYVNPILSQTTEIDDSLCKLLFSSLLKYDREGNLVSDIAERYEISDEGKTYTYFLKKDVSWHDKVQLTARDVAFTIKLIQDKPFRSVLRGDWQNVTVEVVDDHTIAFKLPEPYVPFPNKTTFGILPQHVFGEFSAEKFLVSEFNLKPVGSGPFVFSHFEKDDEENLISYQLLSNKDFHGKKPFLEKINFNFYSSEDELAEAYNKKEINGFGVISPETAGQFAQKKGTLVHSIKTSRYFAIFLNKNKSIPLANTDLRRVLQLATDRDEIINSVFFEYAVPTYSPILESFGEFRSNKGKEQFPFNPDEAEKKLEELGWKRGDDGIRQKDNQKLEISLITTLHPDLAKTGELVKSQWERVGIKVNVSSSEDVLQNFIKPREYQSVLFGQEYFGNDPDPYYFWHSSGKKDPGRNIAVYENSEVDKLLEESRKEQDLGKRQEKFGTFEEKIEQDAPAIFLYSPNYVYITNSKISGIDTSAIINNANRFANIGNWYIKTVRQRKQQ